MQQVPWVEQVKVGVRKVSEEHLNDESKFYFGKHKLDLVCMDLDCKFILDFLMNVNFKDNGKLKSNQDIRNTKMPFFGVPKQPKEEIGKCLASHKKLVVSEKIKGNVEETAADPITAALCQAILTWATEGNNMFVFFWTLHNATAWLDVHPSIPWLFITSNWAETA